MSTTATDLWSVVAAVPDPEMPPLNLGDLGILRLIDVEPGPDGAETVVVTITPTYSGCPAIDAIEVSVIDAVHRAGYPEVRVRKVLSPAWTTDWVTDEGLRKLAETGIAPPRGVAVAIGSPVPCPRCGSTETEQLSRFGATACKALFRCLACAEPFDHFKEL